MNTLNQAFSRNTAGRLAAVQYSGTNGNLMTHQPADVYADMYSYTAAGSVAAKGMEISRQIPYTNYRERYVNHRCG